MPTTTQLLEKLEAGGYRGIFEYIYCTDAQGADGQARRYGELIRDFEMRFGMGRQAEFFSAPGRTEVGGNHTDHQNGRVLAAGVNMDVIAVASKNDEGVIRIKSHGYEMDSISLKSLKPKDEERNKSASLVRGIAARFQALGYEIGGFDACTTSNVLKGSGLSSSAAYEVLVGTILNHLFNDGTIDPVRVAQIGQYAENHYFGKPCGLMDQTASAVGGFVTIDFGDPEQPIVEKVEYDLAGSGYHLCIVDTGGNHADLTDDYASCPVEMRSVAKAMGKSVLREVEEQAFYEKLPALRKTCNDRAILRAMHFFGDNARVPKQVQALRAGDFDTFKALVIESGNSSFRYLQNVYTTKNPWEQGVSLALALSERVLGGRGAWRVHGGGFAGTIQAFVPHDLLEQYKTVMEAALGAGKCHVLSVRPVGGVRVEVGE